MPRNAANPAGQATSAPPSASAVPARAPNPKPEVYVTNSPGSIIAPTGGNNIVINEAPPPEIRVVDEPKIIERTDDHSFDRYFTFEIVAPYALGTLVIRAHGANVRSIGVNPLTQGTASFGHWEAGADHFVKIQSPFGKYQITINTTDAEVPPQIDFGVNQ
jgi:hypothetical protein